MFLPGDLSQVRPSCLPLLIRFAALGGEIAEGSSSESFSRREVVSALLIKNCALVRASVGVVAFISGCSAGFWFTVEQNIRRDLALVFLPVSGPWALHRFFILTCYGFNRVQPEPSVPAMALMRTK